MKIVVCDDDKVFIEDIKTVIEKYAEHSEILTYNDPDKLIKDIKDKKILPNIIFMDIEYGSENNGMYYGHEVYKESPEIQIIYITSYHDRYDQEMFLNDVNLKGYITKPVDEEILKLYIERLDKECNDNKIFNFSMRGKEYVLPVNEIVYFESSNHKTLLHTASKIYNIYEKLGEINDRLPDSFIQCHKSFLVNMDKVKYVEGAEVCIEGGKSVPVSRAHKDDVKRKFFDFIGEKI